MSVLLYVGGGLFLIFVVFSAIAVGIERLREREKSGWRAFPFIVLPVLLPQASAA